MQTVLPEGRESMSPKKVSGAGLLLQVRVVLSQLVSAVHTSIEPIEEVPLDKREWNRGFLLYSNIFGELCL